MSAEKLKELEDAAARAVGYILFEFAKLDIELAQTIVWANEGREIEVLTKKLETKGQSFHFRLELLRELVEKNIHCKATVESYQFWLEKSHEFRHLRNRLVHGRWGFIPLKGEVANVLGLPTSRDQDEDRYSIKQLELYSERLRSHRYILNGLRDTSPV